MTVSKELTGVTIDQDKPIEQQLCQLSDRICAMYNKEEADDIKAKLEAEGAKVTLK